MKNRIGDFVIDMFGKPGRFIGDNKCVIINDKGELVINEIGDQSNWDYSKNKDKNIELASYEDIVNLVGQCNVSLRVANMQMKGEYKNGLINHELATLKKIQELARLEIMKKCDFFVEEYTDDIWNNFVSDADNIRIIISHYENDVSSILMQKIKKF